MGELVGDDAGTAMYLLMCFVMSGVYCACTPGPQQVEERCRP